MYNNQTPYYRRIQARLAKARNVRVTNKLEKYAKVDHFMLTYELAYKAWYGLPIKVSYRHGWYYIGNGKYRHASVEKMTNILLAKLQEEIYPNLEEQENV